ncbi:MAG TPA: TylF/MycF/NovP-related O-methyltransferase [Bacteroidia bacterium]|jgi:O-methyltransferase|nr:TylF/MycF/NovP-related O-methyltransferase [Bacteroidia bacterium]
MEPSSAYIDLLKKMLTDYHRAGLKEYKPLYHYPNLLIKPLLLLDKILRTKNLAISEINDTTVEKRISGQDKPAYADTMMGMRRLNNLEYCIRDVIKNNAEGDFIELGVWRGGATILMRAMLKEMNITNRNVWVADSFEGLPNPDSDKYPADKGDNHSQFGELAVSINEVKQNFEKYGLLDEQVKFLKGWFKDTLPNAPIKNLAILRLDGDMYESTMDGLVNLYPKLSKGGYIIVDDWGAVPACKQATEDYRKQRGITEPIKEIDWTGVYWKKEN